MDSLLQFDRLSNSSFDEAFSTDSNNNTDDFQSPSNISIKEDKYSLRPRSIRRVTDVQDCTGSTKSYAKNSKQNKSHKQKQKPAPLSKYRRKTANARERNRMREINQAFETLRCVIPHMQTAQQVPTTNEKLTKITTLRLAMKYISTLSASLNGPEPGSSSSDTLSDYNDLDCFLLESDGESLPLSDHSLLASPDFPEPSLSPVDFSDPCLPGLFTEHSLEPDDFAEFLLT